MVPEHPSENGKDSNIISEDNAALENHKNVFDIVRNGEVAGVEEFVEKFGSEALKSRDEWGYTPAHWAALDGNIEIMRYLIECNAPVDLSCLGTQGPRPIHWACRKGHTAVVQLLLSAGVAVNATDFKGLTPLMTASMFGRATTAAFLVGMGAFNHLTDVNGDTALHWAAYKGHPDLIRLLMYSGIDLQKPDNFGSTPLHLACLSGNSLCVKILCEKSKIELEPRDKNGKTPLGLAKSHRHSEIVQILMSEMKRRAKWVPPLSEIWCDVQAPLCSLLSHKYPYYADFILQEFAFWGSRRFQRPFVTFYGIYFALGVPHVSFERNLFTMGLSMNVINRYPITLIIYNPNSRKIRGFQCIPITWNLIRGSHYCFIYWNLLMWVSWITANRRDPGYVPLNTDSYFMAIKQIPYFDKWKKRENILSRLCHTCRCLRPLRAKHCRICNRCVRYFDHHCPFIYNCIGVKNRTWFFIFVMSVAINCTFTIYFACYCIAIDGFDMLYVLGLLESLVFCVFGWILTCTSILHACMNLTTNEMFNYKRYPYLRDKRGKYSNPFSRGPFINLFEYFFCAPDPGYGIFEEDSSI